MRKITPAIFVISTLVVLVLCSACVLPFGDQNPKQEGGLTQVTVQQETLRIGFDDAYQKLKAYWTDSSSGPITSKRIYYILATDVDSSGNATSWVFGVKNSTKNELFMYDGKSWTMIPWIITVLPSQEIAFDHIVSPFSLFTKNKELIFNNPSSVSERRDLELQDGIYKLTINSHNMRRVLTFNATAGVLIV
jgi:hypothetical protein